VPYLVGDPTKIADATGWSPQFTLDETLDTVLDHARTRAQGS
jgi:nucleoside-diphosphate-sugar epimerase